MDEVAPLADPRVSMFRDGNWQLAEAPLHTAKPERAGVGLASGFALELLRHAPDKSIGLVPCAVGGTPLSRWVPGMELYETAVEVSKQALANGTLKGML